MAKIKNTKTELKAQMDALARFRRFLPMLQLKKQQLQAEIAAITARIAEVDARAEAAAAAMAPWTALFADGALPADAVRLRRMVTGHGNIAGVTIPVYQGVEMDRAEFDLFETPSWFDDAQEAIAGLLALRAESAVLGRQRELVSHELRTTSQRVNLFEKVKIPDCKENIRKIRIFLNDEQTAAVARGKIAKSRFAQDEGGGAA
ncbi:MAG: V-type ATP synthase subunit D [Kiritimatiellia bacterium]|jgi:V/A-type H+-transporting ATPase subunit D